MPDWKKEISSRLVARYESSTAFRGGRANIYMDHRRDKDFFASMEDISAKEAIFSALSEMESEDLVSIRWAEGEEGNLIERITLSLDPANLKRTYGIAQRPMLSSLLDSLDGMLKAAISKIQEPHLHGFLADCLDDIAEKRRIPRFFFEAENDNKALLNVLIYLSGNSEEISERIMSSHVLHDSKLFERRYRSKVLSILRIALRDEDAESDEELLGFYSVRRYPEILSMRGNITLHYSDGNQPNAFSSDHTCYIDTDELRRVSRIEIHDSHILFIENKASYYSYPAVRNLAIIYHGGFWGKAKERFFMLIAENKGCRFLHFSDIDLGGFRLFVRLKGYIPELEPWCMDEDTLLLNEASAKAISDESYMDSLRGLLQDPSYSCFHSVIKLMLEKRIRLEQESIEIAETLLN